MISNELLNEVLGIDEPYRIDGNEITFWKGGFYRKDRETLTINIYELAHKCKEWAFNQRYELFSRTLSNDSQMRGNCLIIKAKSDPGTVVKIENENTEPEAIFNACQWKLIK